VAVFAGPGVTSGVTSVTAPVLPAPLGIRVGGAPSSSLHTGVPVGAGGGDPRATTGGCPLRLHSAGGVSAAGGAGAAAVAVPFAAVPGPGAARVSVPGDFLAPPPPGFEPRAGGAARCADAATS